MYEVSGVDWGFNVHEDVREQGWAEGRSLNATATEASAKAHRRLWSEVIPRSFPQLRLRVSNLFYLKRLVV